MVKFKPIEVFNNDVKYHENSGEVILHENILEILFKHKEEIHKKLIDLRGTFFIDHIAIILIDPDNRIVIFSITPSVEYNLIVQGLWKHDYSFSSDFQKNNSFYPWEKAYSERYFNEIKSIKELKHKFTFGFNISKRINSFNLIYSFATRNKNNGLFEYYSSFINELSGLGDYGYKLIQNIYAKYLNPKFHLPSISCKKNQVPRHSLKLITNNIG